MFVRSSFCSLSMYSSQLPAIDPKICAVRAEVVLLFVLDYLCNFVTGDGVGGTEENIGYKPTPQACIDACVIKKKSYPEINGVTITPAGRGSCYCEKNMASSNKSPSWKTCRLRKKNDSEYKT